MPAERYFFESPLTQGETVYLKDQEFHHLAHVMRTEVGQRIELVNGIGELGIGEVVEIKKKQYAKIEIKKMLKEPQSPQEVILVQALPRLNRLEMIMEKGTELGMTQIWLLPGDHSERKDIREKQVERMRAITIAAMKQCGRLHLPKILLKPSLKQWREVPGIAYFGDIQEDAPLLSQMLKQDTSLLLFFVGCEAGFSNQEEEKLKALGVKGVKLHKNILRTDTAAITALSILHQFIII